MFEPTWLQVFTHTFAATFSPIPTLAVATKTRRRIEQVRAIDPNHACLHLSCHMKRNVHALAPYAGRQPIRCVVGEFHCFGWSAESHGRQHRAKDFFLCDD